MRPRRRVHGPPILSTNGRRRGTVNEPRLPRTSTCQATSKSTAVRSTVMDSGNTTPRTATCGIRVSRPAGDLITAATGSPSGRTAGHGLARKRGRGRRTITVAGATRTPDGTGFRAEPSVPPGYHGVLLMVSSAGVRSGSITGPCSRSRSGWVFRPMAGWSCPVRISEHGECSSADMPSRRITCRRVPRSSPSRSLR